MRDARIGMGDDAVKTFMKKQNTVQFYKELGNVCTNVIEKIVGVYVFVMLTVFPVFVTDYYFKIIDDKFYFFWVGTAVMLGAVAATALIFCFIDQKEYGGRHTKAFLTSLNPKNIRKQLMLPDYFMLLFMAVSILSTICSEWPYEAFWGNMGRFQGLFLWLWYAVAYVLVTRFFRFRQWYLDAFFAVGIYMAIWGIMDYFGLDPKGWQGMIPVYNDAIIFSSTIGNVNTLTAVFSLYLGASAVMFVAEGNRLFGGASAKEYQIPGETETTAMTERKNWSTVGKAQASARQYTWFSCVRLVFYFITTLIMFAALIAGQSDNAVLSVAAVLCFLPFYAWKNRKGVLRYLWVVLAFFASMAGIGAFTNHFLQAGTEGVRIIPQWAWGTLLKLSNGQTKLMWMITALVAGVLLAAAVLMLCSYALHRGKRIGKNSPGQKNSIKNSVKNSVKNSTHSVAKTGDQTATDTADAKKSNESGLSKMQNFAGFLEQPVSVIPRLIWLMLGILALCLLIWMFYDANTGGHPECYAPYANIFIFNNDWGTHRGYNWSLLLKHIKEFPLLKQLIGSGPETYAIYTGIYDYYDMVAMYGETYDSPHNEFLQYLFCTGILGFIGYYGTMVTSWCSMFDMRIKKACGKACGMQAGKHDKDGEMHEGTHDKVSGKHVNRQDEAGRKTEGKQHVSGTYTATAAENWMNNSFAPAFAFGVIAYTVQSVVNICVPLVVPTVILFTAIGVGISRMERSKGERDSIQ